MRNIERLLDRARLLCTPPTWYQLAKRTGIAQTTLSRCTQRGGSLDNEAAFKLAALLDMEAATVIAYIEEDRAKPEKRDFWRAQLPRLLPTVAVALLCSVVSPNSSAQGATAQDIHYANRRRPWLATSPHAPRAAA